MTQTIGQRLKAEREEQRLTLEKVFEATRIRIQYLQALEADDLSIMPSPVQARGYLRNYAEYLGFDVEQLLAELRAMNAQAASGEVIGPADEKPSLPSNDHQAPQIQSTVSALELVDVIEEKPIPVDEPTSAMSATIPTKPKPARRKKPDPQPSNGATLEASATVEPTTKRRGRKKAATEFTSLVETEPVAQSRVDKVSVPAEPALEPEKLETSVVPAEAISEPVIEEKTNVQQETLQPADVSDTIWQSWLNRLGSALAARSKRRTLIPKETLSSDSEESLVAAIEPTPLEVETQSLPAENSSEILKEIGRELRSRRELLSLHFEEVERNTHVKAHYLDALERGALDDLPSTVQTRGMLSNYATFLDLDVDALLLRFADALQARYRERNPQKPPRKPGQPIVANMPPMRSFIAGDMIFGVGMAILLVGFAVWGVSRVMAIQSQRQIKPTALSISEVLLTAPAPAVLIPTSTLVPVESFPGEATVTVEIPTQNANAQVQLNLVAVERTYMRVTVDGKVAFEGRVVPGNAYPYEAEKQIEVLVGSGAAIRIVYNGRDLGLMGTFGQVVNNIYTGTEVITPTALPTETATITVTPTKTAPPTATSRFTSTPAPSATAVP